MIVFSLAFMVLVFVFYEFTDTKRQILAKIAIAFSIMFALVSAVHYYIQISAIRFALLANTYSGLEHFLQSKPTSIISSVNMLGWTIFLGLSSLFIYLSFRPDIMTKAIRLGLLINTISCLLAGVGYLFQIDLITFIFINIGVGGAFLIITISSIRFFTKLKQE